LLVDNKSAIDLANHPISHGRSKHTERKFHFLRDQVNKIKLQYRDATCNIFTKPLKKAMFDELKKLMGDEETP